MARLVVAIVALAALTGCGAQTPVASLPQTQAPATLSAQSKHPLEELYVSDIYKLRDGGSIEIFGESREGEIVYLKLDGRIGSQTRGHFFIEDRDMMGRSTGLRPLRAAEIAPLARSFEREVAKVSGSKSNWKALLLSEALERLQAYKLMLGEAGGLE